MGDKFRVTDVPPLEGEELIKSLRKHLGEEMDALMAEREKVRDLTARMDWFDENICKSSGEGSEIWRENLRLRDRVRESEKRRQKDIDEFDDEIYNLNQIVKAERALSEERREVLDEGFEHLQLDRDDWPDERSMMICFPISLLKRIARLIQPSMGERMTTGQYKAIEGRMMGPGGICSRAAADGCPGCAICDRWSLDVELRAEREKVRELEAERDDAIVLSASLAKLVSQRSDECEMMGRKRWRQHVEFRAERALSEERRVKLEAVVNMLVAMGDAEGDDEAAKAAVVKFGLTITDEADEYTRLIQPSTEEEK